MTSFYPCFNGIRVLTLWIEVHDLLMAGVSILVLMESGFLLYVSSNIFCTNLVVSILVLMESGFLHGNKITIVKEVECFYPCFNGIRVLTQLKNHQQLNVYTVSILVLMESGFLRTSCVEMLHGGSAFLSLF